MTKYSALKLRVFRTCRLRYKYQYVDKDPQRVRPRLRPADTAGSLVHRVLADFYTKLQPDDRGEAALLSMFDDGWRALSPGYHRVPGVEGHYDASVNQLKNFIRHFDQSRQPYLVEPYIQVDVRPGTTLFGRLDRVDELEDGTLHVIDYKGGAMPGDVDASQLLFYAVMAEIKLDRAVSRVSFWYLDDGSTWSTELSESAKAQTRRDLLATVDAMANVTDYPPTIDTHCAGCPYLQGCAYRSEIAERRGREGW